MRRGLYLCAWAAEFPAQALLRLRTDWQTEPVVVLDGRAPEEWVCSLNRLAGKEGRGGGNDAARSGEHERTATAEALGGE